MAADYSQDIRDRTFEFACHVGRFALTLDLRPGVRSLVDQLLRAGSAPGANLEEAKAASSRREFVRCAEIALREAREAVYWLRICLALGVGAEQESEALRNEGEQIARILGAIVVNAKRRMLIGKAVFAFCILNLASLLF